jgi:hypothetical protein
MIWIGITRISGGLTWFVEESRRYLAPMIFFGMLFFILYAVVVIINIYKGGMIPSKSV